MSTFIRDRSYLVFLRLTVFALLVSFLFYATYFKRYQLQTSFANLIHNFNLSNELPPWISINQVNQFIQETIETNRSKRKLQPQLTCMLPNLPLFNEEIMPVLRKSLAPPTCESDRYPLLFNSVIEPSPRLIPINNLSGICNSHGILRCCMRKISETWKGQDNDVVEYGKNCLPLSFETFTDVPLNWTFVGVECEFLNFNRKETRQIDVFSFIKLKRNEQHGQPYSEYIKEVPPNIIVLLLDSTSRLNFRRVLPEVHEFLINKISAVEIKNFHKVGINTFPNVAALLTGKEIIYLTADFLNDRSIGCEKNLMFDNCSFIWKNFQAAGYKTFYGEDFAATKKVHFLGNGFYEKPTDVYLRPLNLAASSIQHAGLGHATIGTQKAKCFGPRLAFRVLMDNFKRFAVQASNQQTPYFAFLISDTATHDDLTGGRLIANEILQFLDFLQADGHMDNTFVFFLSDHGTLVGEMRNHIQGYLEERLTFLYVAMPKWFLTTGHEAYSNLKENADTKLVTHFDVHKTLIDLLHYANFTNLSEFKVNKSRPGISLFSPIPANRSCKTAGIPEPFCTCNLKITSMKPNEPEMIKTASQAVNEINKIIKGKEKTKLCATLTLNTTSVSAEVVSNVKTNATDLHRIVFETLPGNANFEVLLRYNPNVSFIHDSFYTGPGFSASLERINLYRYDSWCTDDKKLKPFCHCRDQSKD